MMATVPHVTSGSGFRKFQTDGFLSYRVYRESCGIPDMGSLRSDSEWKLGTWDVTRIMG